MPNLTLVMVKLQAFSDVKFEHGRGQIELQSLHVGVSWARYTIIHSNCDCIVSSLKHYLETIQEEY